MISFLFPHVAAIHADDGHWLWEVFHHPASRADRLIRLAVEQGTLRSEYGGVVIDGGLVEAAADAMACRGYDVRIVEGPYYSGRRSEAWFSNEQHAQFANLLGDRTRIVVASRKYVDRIELLRTICNRFPRSTICAATLNSMEAKHISKVLRRYVPHTVHTGMRHSGDNRPQLHLLALGNYILPPQCNVSVAFGTSAAQSQRVQRILVAHKDCVRIALVDSAYGAQRDRDRVLLEAVYGPCVLDADHLPLMDVAHVAILPQVTHRASSESGALERKKRMIWNNEGRNRLLAEVSIRLQLADDACLNAAGIDQLVAVLSRYVRSARPRVAVLVESLAHAAILGQNLPGWSVVTDIAAVGPFGIEADGHIVTLAAAKAVGLTADAVIYAAGGGDRWCNAWSGLPGLSEVQLVVDVGDDFDERSRHELRNRVADYRSRGWNVHWPGHDGNITVERTLLELPE